MAHVLCTLVPGALHGMLREGGGGALGGIVNLNQRCTDLASGARDREGHRGHEQGLLCIAWPSQPWDRLQLDYQC